MEPRDRHLSKSITSSAQSNDLSAALAMALTDGSRSRRQSFSSSVTSRSRRTSRYELVKMHGGTMLLEVDEAKDDAVSLAGMRRDSLSGATTIGGMHVQADTKQVDKLIKNEMAHHSPEIGGDDNKETENNSETASDSQESKTKLDEEPILKYGVMNLLHHFYLAVGSPAIFRIPALAYKWNEHNSGSAFILAYILMVIIVTMPMCALEEVMAQFSSLGTITVFRCLPLLKGVGFGMVAVCFMLMLYSGAVFCWSVLYTFDCLHATLPWTHCLNNVSECIEVEGHDLKANLSMSEKPIRHQEVPGSAMIPSEYYFLYKIIGAPNQESNNSLGLELGISLAFLWLGLLFIMSLGNPWRSGIVSKVTALVTISMLFALMFRGFPLENSGIGLNMVFHVNFTQLSHPDIWLDALGQAAWTMGPTFGFLIARASYKNFRARIRVDVYSATAVNLFVSLVSLISLTPFHGHLHPQGDIDRSPGYFFVLSSYAITKMAIPQLGGVVLYLGVCKGLIDHIHMLASTVVVGITDLLPGKWRTKWRKLFCDSIVCVLGLACGLPFIMTEGLYLMRSVDTFVPWVSALALGFLEVCGLVYLYGDIRIQNHFRIMVRKSLTVFLILWRFIIPPILLGLLLWTSIDGIQQPPLWSSWAHLNISSSREDLYDDVGLILSLTPLAIAFLSTILIILMHWKNLRSLLEPEDTWGPALAQHRALYTYGILRAKSKAPLLVVEVENEVFDGVPYKGWIPYGFFLMPSKFTTLCNTDGFAPTDTLTKKKIAKDLQAHLGKALDVTDGVNYRSPLSGFDLLQRILSDNQEQQLRHNSDFSEDQRSTEIDRIRNNSSLSAGLLLHPNSISENSQYGNRNSNSISESFHLGNRNPNSISESSQPANRNPNSISESSQPGNRNPNSISESSQPGNRNPNIISESSQPGELQPSFSYDNFNFHQ